jgi:hypothetical protein
MNANLLPFLRADAATKYAEQLAAAFAGGNTREQLDRKVVQDEPYAGVVETLKVYRTLKDKDAGYSHEALEKMLAMEKDGTLKDHVAQLSRRSGGGMAPSTQPGN